MNIQAFCQRLEFGFTSMSEHRLLGCRRSICQAVEICNDLRESPRTVLISDPTVSTYVVILRAARSIASCLVRLRKATKAFSMS
jgi:hypothetical protein